MRLRYLLPFLLCTLRAFAAGGTCPSGANYTNPSNPTGASVTLASLGVTSCFYVAANGVDTNTGQDESHPWAHAPKMPNCSNTCASSVPLAAGTGIIFRGGDTWFMSASDSNTPNAGGTWNWNTGTTFNGTAANPIYIGVDITWFTGGAWARPILTMDNPICNLNTLSATCVQNTNSSIDEVVHVTSCAFQASGGNTFFEISARKFYILDNLELTGLCQQSTGQPAHTDDYFSYGSLNGAVTIMNMYVHGWSHLAIAANNGANCTGIVCFNVKIFEGSVLGANNTTNPGENIRLNVVDGTDSDPMAGLCKGGFFNVAYNVFYNTSQCITGTLHSFHDNLYAFFYENGHSNVLESGNNSDIQPAVIYNNVFHDIENAGNGSGGVFLWPFPNPGNTDYFFNNLAYKVGNVEYFNIGNSGSSFGNITAFNNTFESDASNSIFNCQNLQTGTFTDANNHVIVTGGNRYAQATCNGLLVAVTPLTQTNAVATSTGYTASQTFAYSPTLVTSPTVGTGTNEQSTCTTLSGSSDALIQAAGTACQSDTGYACTYNTGNHTVSCPARTSVLRPSAAPFDIGAYQFSSASQAATPTFSPVGGAYSSTQTVTISSATSGAAICYTTDSSTPTANGAGTCTHGTSLSNGGTITVSSNQFVQAVASKSGFTDSAIGAASYTFTPAPAPAIFAFNDSVSCDTR